MYPASSNFMKEKFHSWEGVEKSRAQTMIVLFLRFDARSLAVGEAVCERAKSGSWISLSLSNHANLGASLLCSPFDLFCSDRYAYKAPDYRLRSAPKITSRRYERESREIRKDCTDQRITTLILSLSVFFLSLERDHLIFWCQSACNLNDMLWTNSYN